MSRVRVFVGCSLDGFIAGPDDDLSWLGDTPEAGEDDHGFAEFLSQIGALLMGRRTYDVVAGFEGPWPYGDRPVLVATHRPLDSPHRDVEGVAGSIQELLDRARSAAGDLDVYVDGGLMIRRALDAQLVDELAVTLVPIVLGAGVPLFAGAKRRHSLQLVDVQPLAKGMVKLVYRPRRDASG